MSCRQCCAIQQQFNTRVARRELKRYRKKGPAATTRKLLEALEAGNVAGRSLLDIGGGVGAIQHELLEAGVREVINVDASEAYIDAARTEAERRGHLHQMRFYHGDFVDMAGEIPQADIVTLDRVICCYPDMAQLVRLSAERANDRFALVYPRDTWLNRQGVRILNSVGRLRRSEFRAFIHPAAAVEAILQENGLRRIFHHETYLWQVSVYERTRVRT